jgi:hypothetical protein
VTAFRFIPIDHRAKDGGYHLLRAAPRAGEKPGAEYSARWSADRARWELSCTCPVEEELTHWATTLPEISTEKEAA